MASQGKSVVLVIGATGRQGGAALTAMLRDLSQQYAFRALTRNPDSEKSRKLAERGVQVVKGDTADKASLEAAMKGVWGVYLVTDPFNNGGSRPEAAQGIEVVETAFSSGVSFFVFASSGGIDADAMGISQFPFVASKRDIEKAIASKPWPVGWSSIGPTAFFENIEMFAPLTKGTFSYAAQGDMKLYWISAADIGEFVCKAFAKPEEYNGKKIEIAGDELSPNEMAAILTEITETKWTYKKVPPYNWIVWFISKDLYDMISAFDRLVPAKIDIDALKTIHPGLQNFRDWCASKGIDKPGKSTYKYTKTWWETIFG